MPIVLVLFAIALVITFTGLFLSPRSQPRRQQNEYLVTPRGRRIVDSTPAPPPRMRRVVEIAGAELDLVARPLKSRASSVNTQSAGPRAVALARPAASMAYPGLRDRFGSWKVVVPAVVAASLLVLYILSATVSHSLLWTTPFFGSPSSANASDNSSNNTTNYTASQHLARLGQLDPAQYKSTQEYNMWAYSACSAASMTEVINAYGHHYRITDILEIEANIHEITPQLGLLEESGIAHTGAQFGFKTTWGHNLSLDQVIAAANKGTPVIVSFPPAKFDGGHILVVRGGDSSTVKLADSSRLNWTQLTRQRFLQLWGGFSAIMTPK